MKGDVEVSVIVPVLERPESLVDLYQEFRQPLETAGLSHEFIFATHPGTSALLGPLEALQGVHAPVRALEFGHPVGEAAMLRTAVLQCQGEIIVTLPAYRQVEAGCVLGLIERVRQGADLAVAWRWPRHDAWINGLRTRLLHAMVGRLAGGRLHDIACGARAMRPYVLREIRLYGDIVRYLPLVARREGFLVEEVQSPVHPRAMGRRGYGLGLYLRRLLDILALMFLFRFTDKPLRFFGFLGSLLSLAGGAMLAILLVERLSGASGIADRPWLLLGVLLLTLGIQAIALGLIGEMIVHLNASRRAGYRVRGERALTLPARERRHVPRPERGAFHRVHPSQIRDISA